MDVSQEGSACQSILPHADWLASTYSFISVVTSGGGRGNGYKDMIPGSASKLSETTVASANTIAAKSDIVVVTGTTTINNITPNFGGGFGGFCVLVPVSGVTLGTGGNILVGIAAAANRSVFLVYVKSLGKWVINSGV